MKTIGVIIAVIGILAVGTGFFGQQANAATWSFVDSGINAAPSPDGVSPDNSVFPQYPVAATDNSSLYVAWLESLSAIPQIRARIYNGSAWGAATTVAQDRLVSQGNRTNKLYTIVQGIPYAMASLNGTPFVAYTEQDSPFIIDGVPQGIWGNSRIHVRKFNGTTWEDANNNDYNINNSNATGLGGTIANPVPCNPSPSANINHVFNADAKTPALLAANNAVYAAWYERENSQPRKYVRVARHNGTLWQIIDGGSDKGLLYNPTTGVPDEQIAPIMAWYNGKLYVGWVEDSKLRVIQYTPGSPGTWTIIDGNTADGLAYNPANYPWYASLTVHNGLLYAFWAEATYGGTFEVRYKTFNGTAWSSDGSADGSGWNKDTSRAVSYPSAVSHPTGLYAAWSEADYFNSSISEYVMQIRAAVSTGSGRTMIDGNAVTGLNGNTTLNADRTQALILNDKLYVVWYETDNSSVDWIRAKMYPLPPYVTSVSAPANATYKVGDYLSFTVNFNRAVTVTGTPSLPITLDTGGTVQAAYYPAGSTATALVFRYQVQSGNLDTDGITVGALNLNGGSLVADSLNADLTLNSVASTASVLVDGVAPTAAITYSPAGPYKTGDSVTITATFSEAMVISPAPQIAISGSNTLPATNMTRSSATVYTYAHNITSGSGTATVALSAGTDVPGNVVIAAPTSGATFIVIPVPAVTSNAASSITATGATLNGTVNANGYSTLVTFDYGLTSSYTSTGIAATPSPVTGSANTAVAAAISSLTCNTLYHFRVNGVSSGGTVNGGDLTFTTGSCNTTPAFVGATTTLTVNKDSSNNDIKSLLHVSDSDAGQTETWTQSAAPGHGTVSFTGATAASGSADITPGGTITYTPTGGYSGGDSFTVQVSDGTATATRTITVTVNPMYTVTYTGNGATAGNVPIDGNSYTSGATVTVLANSGGLVKTGYTFAGWNTMADGTGTTYDASGSATFTAGTANVTLYAQWSINSYSVTGNAVSSGGTISCSPSSVTYGGGFSCSICPGKGYDLVLLSDNNITRTFSVDGNCYSYAVTGVAEAHTIEATYQNFPVIILQGVNSDTFSAIQLAANAATQSNDRIQVQAGPFTEDVSFDHNGISAFLEGGFDPGFSGPVGETIIRGKLMITSGTLTVDGITIE